MNVQCVAVIGPQNNPMFLKNYTKNTPDLTFHYLVHSVLDVIEQKSKSSTELYLSLLTALEDMVAYGYMTNSKVKLIVVLGVSESPVKETDLRNLMKKLHHAYIALISNPFFDVGSVKSIRSPQFHHAIDHLVHRQ